MDIGLGHVPTTLESRFDDLDTPVLLSGIQALVRVLLEQARLDRAAGLNTGGLVSGYRGSPLGGLDRELWRRQKLLTARNIRFQPGVNEDLAATMLYGTQQLDAFPGKRVDGVFGMWYGKGPGVDRAGDALHCGNFMGTSKHGGVLAVSGDDHGAHSSTYPHQTEHVFEGVFIPVLNPASVAGHVDLGLAGIALSRYSGLWIALKTTAETAEQAATLIVPSTRHFITPDFALPPHGLNFDPHPALSRRPRRAGAARGAGAHAGGAGLGTRQPARPADVRHAPTRRSASSPSAARTPTRCTRCACWAWSDHAQIALYKVAHDVAAGDRGPARVRPRQARAAGGRGEAQLRRDADPRRAVQPARGRSGRRSAARPTPSGAPLLSPLLELSPEIVATGLARVSARRRPERARPAGAALARAAGRPAARASRPSAPAARTAPRRSCPRAASPPPASAATSWRWTRATRPAPSRIWAARARPSSAWRRSPTCRTCSPTWATAPTHTPASWRSARRSRRRRASPTSCWSTTRWR